MNILWGGGLRWSYNTRAWFGAIASMSDGRLLCRHELTWIRTEPDIAAKEILAKLAEWRIPALSGGVYANAELWPTDPGKPSDSEAFTSAKLPSSDARLPLNKGATDRVNGLSCVRKWLSVREQRDGTLGPSLLIHPDCKQLIRTLPVLVSDRLNVDDVEVCAEENPVIGLMHYLMSRPMPTLEIPEPPPGPGTWGHALAHVYAGRQRNRGLLGGFRYR